MTAVLGRDLCRLSSDALARFQLDLVTDCKNSILYLTDAQAALIERRGIRDLSELEKHLYIRGRDNFYPGSDLLLRLNPTGDPKNFVTYGFAGRSESWYQEESPRFTLMWKSLPAGDLPLDQHVPADYLLDESEQNPACTTAETRKPAPTGPCCRRRIDQRVRFKPSAICRGSSVDSIASNGCGRASDQLGHWTVVPACWDAPRPPGRHRDWLQARPTARPNAR